MAQKKIIYMIKILVDTHIVYFLLCPFQILNGFDEYNVFIQHCVDFFKK